MMRPNINHVMVMLLSLMMLMMATSLVYPY